MKVKKGLVKLFIIIFMLLSIFFCSMKDLIIDFIEFKKYNMFLNESRYISVKNNFGKWSKNADDLLLFLKSDSVVYDSFKKGTIWHCFGVKLKNEKNEYYSVEFHYTDDYDFVRIVIYDKDQNMIEERMSRNELFNKLLVY